MAKIMGFLRFLTRDRSASSQALAEQAKRRGDDFFRQGRLVEAEQALREAVRLNPEYVDALANLGYVLRERGDLDQAELVMLRALGLAPDFWAVQANLGLIAEARQDRSCAAAYFRRTLELEPNQPDIISRLHRQLVAMDDQEAAASLVQVARRLQPTDPEQRSLLAMFLAHAGLRDEAILRLRAIMRECPTPTAARTLGAICQETREIDEAQRWYEKAIELDPRYPQPHWDLALLRLLRGDFERGWPEFEAWLPTVRGEAAIVSEGQQIRGLLEPERQWAGEVLVGKRLLVWTEFGLGDSLMFMRFLPAIKNRWQAQSVAVLCEPALCRLIGSLEGVDQVIAKPTDLAPLKTAFDAHCSLLTLPARFDARPEALPTMPYIRVARDRLSNWRPRLAGLGPGLKIGLCWAGGKALHKNHLRSLPLTLLLPLFDLAGMHWISLQQGEPAKEAQQNDLPLHDWMSECPDLLDTASLIANLDLVISADTAVAHLAGAAGVPIWLLNRFESEWRWQIGKEDSAWYPSMRIFNQANEGDWAEVIARVGRALTRSDGGDLPESCP